MNARIVTTATLFIAFAGTLPVEAADSQLLGLVMPDAKVLAGVNVDQAKGTPFGVYVLTQIQSDNNGLQQLIALTGFDPTRDVHEVLAASNSAPGAKQPSGLVLARGNFDVTTITNLATSKGALTETYKGVTIIEDPKKTGGLAFLNATLVMAGDIANVKAAIDRPSNGQTLPTAVSGEVNQWSASSDAWLITTVPPATLLTNAIPGNATALVQQVQQFAGGVKFGNNVVGTAVIQSDNAQDATQLANALQFLINLAQMQAQSNPQIPNLSQAVNIAASGSSVKLTVTLPQAQFQQLIQHHQPKAALVPQHREMR